MHSNRRSNRDESSTPKDPASLPGRDGLPFGQDAADIDPGPDVQANGQAASRDVLDGLAEAPPIRAKPDADPFDLSSLRLSQDFALAVGVKRLVTTVPLKKSTKEWFVRTHPDPGFRLPTAMLELKEDQESYLVSPALRSELASEPTFRPTLLVTSINRQGVLFLWKLRLPGPDGRVDDWMRSAMDAAELAKSRWVRATPSMSLGAYDVTVATGILSEPSWPDVPFQEIIKIAFRDKMISEWGHPVLRRLRGEV